MDNLFEAWKTRIPKYSIVFKEKLFDVFSQHGGGSEATRVAMGKHFANNYELYMYAFFLGFYRREFIPIPDGEKRVDFSHHIQHWGSKGGKLERKDFTSLQDFMFMALVTKTDIDFIALDKGELSEAEAVKALLTTMEGYTNGGLTLILEKFEDSPGFFLQPTSFLDMILSSEQTNKVDRP